MEYIFKYAAVAALSGIVLMVVLDFWETRKEFYWGDEEDDDKEG